MTAREFKVRWRKGMGSLLLLGAAYAVLEEGLMVASFQNPGWMDLGVLGVFGRWLGVNWVWAVELTCYHAIVSITIPVMLVELAYPEAKGEPWLKGIWRLVIPGLLLADVVAGLFIFSEFTGFSPPLSQYSFLVLVTVIFVFLAWRMPSDWARRGTKPMRQPRFYAAATMAGAFACGAIFWILPNALKFPLAPIFVILLGAATVLGLIRFLAGHDWKTATPMHRFGLVAGALAPFIIFSFLQEFDASRTDDTSGMSLVGIAFLIGLLLFRRKIGGESDPR